MTSVSSGWSVHRFLSRLSSAEPSPGGGSAAALASALGCAVAGKVCRLVLKRRRTLARPSLRKIQSKLDRLSRRLEGLIREDALAYARLVRAMRTGRGRKTARAGAVRCPLAICDLSVQALKCVTRLRPLAGRYLGSDLKAARALLKAGFEGADLMVKINLETKQ